MTMPGTVGFELAVCSQSWHILPAIPRSKSVLIPSKMRTLCSNQLIPARHD